MTRSLQLRLFVFFILFTLMYSCKNVRTKNDIVEKAYDQSLESSDSIKFHWEPVKINGNTIKRGAMVIPVRLEGVDRTFQMEFDFGLTTNIMYGQPLDSIFREYPGLKENLQQRKTYQMFYNRVQFGNLVSDLDSLYVQKNYGENLDIRDLSIIGAIGIKEIEHKIVVIDFKNQNLFFTKRLEKWEEDSFSFTPLVIKDHKMILNLNDGERRHPFLLETSSSFFPLATTNKELFHKLQGKKENIAEILPMESWGQNTLFQESTVKTPLRIGGFTLPSNLNKVFYVESPSAKKALEKIGAEGIIGTDLLLDHTIVIDLANNRFGIK